LGSSAAPCPVGSNAAADTPLYFCQGANYANYDKAFAFKVAALPPPLWNHTVAVDFTPVYSMADTSQTTIAALSTQEIIPDVGRSFGVQFQDLLTDKRRTIPILEKSLPFSPTR
jgi:hypothetical protein